MSRFAPLLVAFSTASSPLAAQSVIYEWADAGIRVAALEDWDGDGVQDFATSSSAASGLPVQIRSGLDGSVLQSFANPFPGGLPNWHGRSVHNVGDVDGDGRDDLAIANSAAPSIGGYVDLHASGTGALIRRLADPQGLGGNYGHVVAPAGDLDGDGRGDVLVTNPTVFATEGYAEVRSSATGALLVSWTGGALSSEDLGRAAFCAGDIDGDGLPDYVISAADNLGSSGGRVHVLSGTGASIHELGDVSNSAPGFGLGLHPLGDYDGDGIRDMLVQTSGWGGVEVYSTATGLQLSSTYFTPPGHGECLAGVTAVDVTGLLPAASGHAVLLSLNGCYSIGPSDSGFLVFDPLSGEVRSEVRFLGQRVGGFGLARAGDLTGDGVDEFLMSTRDNGQPGSPGGGVALDLTAGWVERICDSPGAGWPMVSPRIHCGPTTSISSGDFALAFTGLAGAGNGLLLVGPNESATPLGNGTLCLGTPIVRLQLTGPAEYTGEPVPIDVTQPLFGLGSITPGSSWLFQLWFRDSTPVGHGLTDAVRVTFAP